MLHTVTDFINALPGNSSVKTVQHATIDEVVFSMSSAPSNSRNGVLCDQLLGYATVLTIKLCFLCGPYRGYITRFPEFLPSDPCGGGVDTSTVTLRVAGGDEIGSLKWDSKIWSRVPRDSDPRKTALERASSIYKRQTRPLVRERAPHINKPATVWQ
jgi:hypothetical protein